MEARHAGSIEAPRVDSAPRWLAQYLFNPHGGDGIPADVPQQRWTFARQHLLA